MYTILRVMYAYDDAAAAALLREPATRLKCGCWGLLIAARQSPAYGTTALKRQCYERVHALHSTE